MRPVILVHGYNDGTVNQAEYVAEWEALMASHGHEAHAIALPGNWADQNAYAVRAKINALGAPKVDIVAHSFGCMASRYYLKHLYGHLKTERMIFLGALHDGWAANFYGLNIGDDTPGMTLYYDIYGPEDNHVSLDMGQGRYFETFLDVPHYRQPFNPLVVARVNEILRA